LQQLDWWHGEDLYEVSPPTGTVCLCKVTVLVLKVIPLIISFLYDKPQISLQMVGFVKVDPIEASALDMTNATRGQPTRFLGLGFSVVSLEVGYLLEGSEADGRAVCRVLLFTVLPKRV
jgi:hypothetical protein